MNHIMSEMISEGLEHVGQGSPLKAILASYHFENMILHRGWGSSLPTSTFSIWTTAESKDSGAQTKMSWSDIGSACTTQIYSIHICLYLWVYRPMYAILFKTVQKHSKKADEYMDGRSKI